MVPRGLRTERELGGGGCDGAGPLADEVKVRQCTVENPLDESADRSRGIVKVFAARALAATRVITA